MSPPASLSRRAVRHVTLVGLGLGLSFPLVLIGAILLVDWLAGVPGVVPDRVGELVGVAVATPYALAPLFAYVWLLFGDSPPLPEHEPCTDSGSFLGGHWFEFASLPGRRIWTRDTEVADAIRARPCAPLHSEDVFDLLVALPPDTRPGQHLAAGTATLLLGLLSMVAAFVASGLSLSAVALWAYLQSSALYLFGVAYTFIIGLWAFLATLVGFTTVFVGVFATVFLLWNLVLRPRRAAALRATSTLLQSKQGAVPLDSPELQVDLAYGVFGCRLRVGDGATRTTLVGPHRVLQPLAAWLRERPRASHEDRSRMDAALASLHHATGV